MLEKLREASGYMLGLSQSEDLASKNCCVDERLPVVLVRPLHYPCIAISSKVSRRNCNEAKI